MKPCNTPPVENKNVNQCSAQQFGTCNIWLALTCYKDHKVGELAAEQAGNDHCDTSEHNDIVSRIWDGAPVILICAEHTATVSEAISELWSHW